eukprot:4966861-Amphidinium_carterae.2
MSSVQSWKQTTSPHLYYCVPALCAKPFELPSRLQNKQPPWNKRRRLNLGGSTSIHGHVSIT